MILGEAATPKSQQSLVCTSFEMDSRGVLSQKRWVVKANFARLAPRAFADGSVWSNATRSLWSTPTCGGHRYQIVSKILLFPEFLFRQIPWLGALPSRRTRLRPAPWRGLGRFLAQKYKGCLIPCDARIRAVHAREGYGRPNADNGQCKSHVPGARARRRHGIPFGRRNVMLPHLVCRHVHIGCDLSSRCWRRSTGGRRGRISRFRQNMVHRLRGPWHS